MGKRKQPFGYKMKLGEIVPQPQEAETVRSIYLQYNKGGSTWHTPFYDLQSTRAARPRR